MGKEIDSCPLSSNDLRTSYIEYMYSVLLVYYYQLNTNHAAKIVKDAPIGLTAEQLSILETFVGTVEENAHFYSIRNSNNRGLFIDSWSAFEFFLTYVCEQLLNETDKASLLEYDYKEIGKILSRYEVNEGDTQKVKKLLIKGSLTHVPVARKYNKLYSLNGSHYGGDWNEDKVFLEFYGKYRNTMHTNYIYHGTSKQYKILGITYDFTDGNPIGQSKFPDERNMFDLALRLKTVGRLLFDSIQYSGLLEYPADKVPQP